MNRSAAERRFEREVEQWDRIYDGGGPWLVRTWNAVTRSNVRRRFDATFDLMSDWAGATVLDVGCGSGRYLARAASLGATQLTGVDVSQGMLDLAARRLGAAGVDAELHRGTFPDVTIEGTFDAVIVVGVLDYTADAGALLAGAARCCAGRVAATFPSRFAPRSVPRAIYWRSRGLGTHYYTRGDVSRLAAGAGLRTERIIRIGPILLLDATPDASRSV